jgi:hypothetical protein
VNGAALADLLATVPPLPLDQVLRSLTDEQHALLDRLLAGDMTMDEALAQREALQQALATACQPRVLTSGEGRRWCARWERLPAVPQPDPFPW